jgi:IS5 family transposase
MLPNAHGTGQCDPFKSDLIAIIDSNRSLVSPTDKIDWQQFEKSLHPTYVPEKGAPAINTRLMVALHILKFQHNLSDQAVVDRWVENRPGSFLRDTFLLPSTARGSLQV